MTESEEQLREEIDIGLRTFAPSELYAVRFVIRRLIKGRRQYGVLNPMDGRDWLNEAGQEAADFLVYMSAYEMEREGLGA